MINLDIESNNLDIESNNLDIKSNIVKYNDSDIFIPKKITFKKKNNILIKPNMLINEHLFEIKLRILSHTKSALLYEKREKIIGYPITILSSFLSSTIMLEISNNDNIIKSIFSYISLCLSIISFLLSISRQYFEFSKKFQSHDLSSKLYTNLLRSFEVRLIKNHINNDERHEIFKDIVDQMSIIEQYEIPIPEKIDKKIRLEYETLDDFKF